MLVLVILLGTDHPPTADDRCRLGLVRRAIGWAALLIPILCFPPLGITPIGSSARMSSVGSTQLCPTLLFVVHWLARFDPLNVATFICLRCLSMSAAIDLSNSRPIGMVERGGLSL